MNQIKKYLYLVTHMFSLKRDLKNIGIAIGCSVSIIIMTLIVIEVSEKVSIEEAYQYYGKYTAVMDYDSVQDIEKLKQDNRVVDVFSCYRETIVKEDYTYDIYYSNDKIIEFCNFDILEGSMPQTNYEVAVERDYLVQLGIPTSEMIGAKIRLPNQDSKEENLYEVTGIIYEHEEIEEIGMDTFGSIILNENQKSPNQLYIQIEDVENYEKVLDAITADYGINKEECYGNYHLFTEFGITVGENQFEKNRESYYIVFAIVLLCTLVVVYNFIKLFIYKNYKEIAIMNMIGISKRQLSICLLLVIGIAYLIGVLCGIGIGMMLAVFILEFVLMINTATMTIIANVPVKVVLLSMVLYFLICMCIVIPVLVMIYRSSPNHMIQTRSIQGFKPKNKTHLFKKKTLFYKLKLVQNNIRTHKISFVVAMIGFSLSIVIFVIGIFFVELNLELFTSDTKMDYYVSCKDEFSITEEEAVQKTRLYNELLEREECVVYPEYQWTITAKIEKEKLQKQHLRYLEEVTNLVSVIDNPMLEDLDMKVVVLGYNERQLKELGECNGIELDTLKDNEIIMLNRTIPFKNRAFTVEYEKGEVIFLTPSQEEKQEFVIKEMVNELPMYPEGQYNEICIIVSDDTYKNFYDITQPDDYYIKLKSKNTAHKQAIEKMLSGHSFLSITFLKDEEKMLKEGNEFLRKLIIVFFTIFVLLNSISLISILNIKIYTKEYEYAALNAIGLRQSQIGKIIYMEIGIIYLVASVVAIVLSYFISYYLQIEDLGNAGKYLYCYPIKIYIIANVMTLLILVVCSLPIRLRINNMNTLAILKRDN